MFGRGNVEKYFRATQVIDDNMAHALCTLDKNGYIHTFTLYNSS